jgi:hypothetical protein
LVLLERSSPCARLRLEACGHCRVVRAEADIRRHRNDDVIKGVNGSPFTTTRTVMEWYDALKGDGTVALGIQRDKTKQKLLFEIR